MVRPKSDAPKEHFLGIKLTDEMHEDLKRVAKELDRPKSWVVREALAAYLQPAKAGAKRKGAK